MSLVVESASPSSIVDTENGLEEDFPKTVQEEVQNKKVSNVKRKIFGQNNIGSTWGGILNIKNNSKYEFKKLEESSHQMDGKWVLPDCLKPGSSYPIRVEFENSVTIDPLDDHGETTYVDTQGDKITFKIYAKGDSPIPKIGGVILELKDPSVTVSPQGEVGMECNKNINFFIL